MCQAIIIIISMCVSIIIRLIIIILLVITISINYHYEYYYHYIIIIVIIIITILGELLLLFILFVNNFFGISGFEIFNYIYYDVVTLPIQPANCTKIYIYIC